MPRAIGLRQKIAQEVEFGFHIGRGEDFERKVGSIETGDDALGLLESEQVNDVILHARRGGGGQRQHDRRVEVIARVGDVQIIGAKVVAPLRQAVRFVDGEQADRDAAERFTKGAAAQPLRRNEHDLEAAFGQGAEPIGLF